MLILSRKLDESIVIADNIEVKIISIDKGVVKLGIEAPPEVLVLRQELVNAVKNANQSASVQTDTSILDNLYKTFLKKQ